MARLFNNDPANYLLRTSTNLGLNGTTECSFGFSFRGTGATGLEQRIVEKEIDGIDGWTTIKAKFLTDGSSVVFEVGNNALGQAPNWRYDLGSNITNWHRFLFTFKKNAISAADGIIYIDGINVGGLLTAGGYTAGFTIQENSSNLYYGLRAVTQNQPLNGALANVSVWNRQLTAAEAAADGGRPRAVSTNLIHFVELCPETDLGSLGFDMTVVGTPSCVAGPLTVSIPLPTIEAARYAVNIRAIGESTTVQAGDVAQAPVVIIQAADGLTLGLSESVSPVFQQTEGIPIHTTETASVVSTVTANESLAVRGTDLAAILVTLTVTDTISIVDSEIPPQFPLVVTASDSAKIQASEATPTIDSTGSSINPISAFDSCSLGLTDTQLLVNVAQAASDSIFVQFDLGAFGENTTIFAFTPQQQVSLSVVDTCVVQVIIIPINQTPKSASDTCRIQLIEPEAASSNLAPSDTLHVTSSEATPAIFTTGASTAFVSATDAISIGASDATPTTVKTIFIASISAVDLIPFVASTEVITLASDFYQLATVETLAIALFDVAGAPVVPIVATDTLACAASETLRNAAQAVALDTAVIAVAEVGPLVFANFSFNVSDSAPVSASETVQAFSSLQAILASDTLPVHATEDGPMISAVVSASESLQLSMNDASLLLLRFLSLTDALSLPVTEALFLFNTFVQLTTTDSCKVQGVEAINFLQTLLTQLTTTELLSLGLDEQLLIDLQSATTDLLAQSITEDTDTLRSLFVDDSLAFRIDSEDLNIINPFIINVFMSVDDFVTTNLADAMQSQQSLLGFYVSDVVLLGFDDAVSMEDIPLPTIAEFMTETSYATVEAPQSYRILSGKFW